MTVRGVSISPRLEPAEFIRWSLCLALVLVAHGAALLTLSARHGEEPEPDEGAPIVMIELAPVAVAPTVQRSDLPPGPVQPEAQETPPQP